MYLPTVNHPTQNTFWNFLNIKRFPPFSSESHDVLIIQLWKRIFFPTYLTTYLPTQPQCTGKGYTKEFCHLSNSARIFDTLFYIYRKNTLFKLKWVSFLLLLNVSVNNYGHVEIVS